MKIRLHVSLNIFLDINIFWHFNHIKIYMFYSCEKTNPISETTAHLTTNDTMVSGTKLSLVHKKFTNE